MAASETTTLEHSSIPSDQNIKDNDAINQQPNTTMSSHDSMDEYATAVFKGSSTTLLRRAAADIVNKNTKNSALFNNNLLVEERIPKFNMDELTVGRVLGRGGFAVVSEINSIQLQKGQDFSTHNKKSSSFRKSLFKSMRGRIGSTSNHQSSHSMDSFVENSYSKNNSSRCSKNARFLIKKKVSDTIEENESELSSDHDYFNGGFVTSSNLNGEGQQGSGGSSNTPSDDITGAGNISNGGGGCGKVYTREDIAAKCLRRGKPRFVIKTLSDYGAEICHEHGVVDYSCTNRSERKLKAKFIKGTIDIAMEVKFLSILSHPNIIKLRGLSNSSPFQDDNNDDASVGSSLNYSNNFFLIIDKLVETLPKRISKKWTTIDRQTKGITGALTGGGKRKRNDLLIDRLLTVYDICSAMSYLHSHNIIYRDLKPDNIGFDVHGNLKLFDFGLAKELQSCYRIKQNDSGGNKDDFDDSDYTYRKMTGFTGAIRYMSPENGLKKPYGLKSDIYSFGMCFWYILALEPPFAMYTPKMIYERVIGNGTRPLTFVDWSESLCVIMKACWDENQYVRPSFNNLKRMLRDEITKIRPDYNADQLDKSNNSSVFGGGGGRI